MFDRCVNFFFLFSPVILLMQKALITITANTIIYQRHTTIHLLLTRSQFEMKIMEGGCNTIIFLALVSLVFLNRGKCTTEAVYRKIKGKYLPDNAYKILKTNNELHCSSYCSSDASCVSVNFKTSGKESGLCELNNKAMAENDGQNNAEYNYLGIVTRVGSCVYEQLCYCVFIIIISTP